MFLSLIDPASTGDAGAYFRRGRHWQGRLGHLPCQRGYSRQLPIVGKERCVRDRPRLSQRLRGPADHDNFAVLDFEVSAAWPSLATNGLACLQFCESPFEGHDAASSPAPKKVPRSPLEPRG
jgi:hypothetical protein